MYSTAVEDCLGVIKETKRTRKVLKDSLITKVTKRRRKFITRRFVCQVVLWVSRLASFSTLSPCPWLGADKPMPPRRQKQPTNRGASRLKLRRAMTSDRFSRLQFYLTMVCLTNWYADPIKRRLSVHFFSPADTQLCPWFMFILKLIYCAASGTDYEVRTFTTI